MAIGLELGSVIDEIGSASFVRAMRATIAGRLEGFRPGSVYPLLQRLLTSEPIAADRNAELAAELSTVRAGLRRIAPDKVIWDLDDDAARPPWGSDIAAHITSLETYFVTSTGRDVLNLIDEAIAHQREIGETMRLVPF